MITVIMAITITDIMITTAKKIFRFYAEGFKNMRLGKTLWGIIAIKFVLFFVIIKMLFFPNFLNEQFDTDTQRANHVINNLIEGR